MDREKIARRLSEQRPAGHQPLQICIEVNVSGEASKSGVAPADLLALAQSIAGLPGLRLRGLMAIPEPTGDMARQRRRFAQLRALLQELQAKLAQRRSIGRRFSLIVVSESAHPIGTHGSGGRAGQLVVDALKQADPELDTRLTVLGHLQRGGSPNAVDRVLATRFGCTAVDLVEAGRWGEMVALQNGRVIGVPLAEAVRSNRVVDLAGELVATARAVGVELGG